jgi:hypothetical protein
MLVWSGGEGARERERDDDGRMEVDGGFKAGEICSRIH